MLSRLKNAVKTAGGYVVQGCKVVARECQRHVKSMVAAVGGTVAVAAPSAMAVDYDGVAAVTAVVATLMTLFAVIAGGKIIVKAFGVAASWIGKLKG